MDPLNRIVASSPAQATRASPQRGFQVVVVALVLGLVFFGCKLWLSNGSGQLWSRPLDTVRLESRHLPLPFDTVLASIPSDHTTCDLVYGHGYLVALAEGRRNLCRAWDWRSQRAAVGQTNASDLACYKYIPPKLGVEDEFDPRTYSFCDAKNVLVVPAEGGDPQDVSYAMACKKDDALVKTFGDLYKYWGYGVPSTLIRKTKFMESWLGAGSPLTCDEALSGPVRVFVKRDAENPAHLAQVQVIGR